MVTKSGTKGKRDFKQIKADQVKKADQNGGVAVMSLQHLTPEEVVDLFFSNMDEDSEIIFLGSSFEA